MILTNSQKLGLSRFACRLQTALANTFEYDPDSAFRKAGFDPDTFGPMMPTLLGMAGETETAASREDSQANDSGPEVPDAPKWMVALFGIVMSARCGDKDAVPTRERITRLRNCLMAIPEFGHYAALVREYTGTFPDGPRPGRDPHEPSVACHGSIESQVSSALAFLRDPRRVTYVLHGTTNMSASFSPDVIALLADVQVHIPADLERYSDPGLMFIPGITPAAVSQIHIYRSRLRNPD